MPLTLTSYSPCFRKEKGAHAVVLDYLRDGRFDLAEQALRSHLEQVQQRMFAK